MKRNPWIKEEKPLNWQELRLFSHEKRISYANQMSNIRKGFTVDGNHAIVLTEVYGRKT